MDALDNTPSGKLYDWLTVTIEAKRKEREQLEGEISAYETTRAVLRQFQHQSEKRGQNG